MLVVMQTELCPVNTPKIIIPTNDNQQRPQISPYHIDKDGFQRDAN